MKRVQDVLDHKGSEVQWIDPLESVFEAARMMREHHVGALLVQIDGFLVGIVSERDYVTKVILDHAASQKTKVSEIMTREVVSVGPDESILNCVNLMKDNHFRHLPVVDAGKPVGILSLRDLFIEVMVEGYSES